MRLSHSAEVGQEEGDKAREVERGSLGHLVTNKALTRRGVGPTRCSNCPLCLLPGKELLAGRQRWP